MNDRQIRRLLDRRSVLRSAFFGAAGLAVLGRTGLPVWAAPRKSAGDRQRPEAKAKAVIEVWLAGGPSHTDTFDPKPGAGHDIHGPLTRTAPSNVAGIELNESMPLMAKCADKYSIIRSMTHGINGHETAAYCMQTGRRPGEGEQGLTFPSFGAVVSYFKGYRTGYEGMIPPYVVLTRPQGRFAVEGFLGIKHKPFVTGGDPRRARFAVEGIVLKGVSDERQRARRDLLHGLDTLGQAMPEDPELAQMDRCEEKAYDLVLGDAGKVFDLTQEPDEVRERYGRNTLGQSCLAARRLVAQGVPYVTINSGGWDTHKRHFESMRQKLPELDRALSALFEDLAQRGMLDSTIVWCTGEFGRGPKVQWDEPWNGGRSHFGRCFSVVVGGGGFQGGHVVGASDETSEYVAERPVAPHDFFSSMHTQLGIDPYGLLARPRGIEVKVQPPSEEGRGRGILKEIM